MGQNLIAIGIILLMRDALFRKTRKQRMPLDPEDWAARWKLMGGKIVKQTFS